MSVGGGTISGLGTIFMWGHSPARDIVQLIPGGKKSLETNESDEQTLRILLVGQVDLRHVLQTIGTNIRFLGSQSARIDFYLAEDCLEVIAREMMLLLLAIQPTSTIGLHEKSTQWLELFGNTLIRPKTRKTFLEMTEILIQSVMNPEEESVFDLSDLKFRERDYLVEIFKHWKSVGDIFPIQENWKKRLENHLGSRYDVRKNLFDYDYHMRLLEKRPSPSIISSEEYKKWRETGVAFADFDSEYSQPNVSLGTGITTGGRTFLSYRGEIVTGPFIPFGIEADDASLFEKVNGNHKSTSCNISIHNLQRIFKGIAEVEKPLATLFKVNFLSPSTFGRPRFLNKIPQGFFDAAYFSSSSAHWLLPPITNLLKPNSPILVEDTEFLLELLPSQSKLYRDKVLELGSKCVLDLNPPEGDSPYIQFVKNPNSLNGSPEDLTGCGPLLVPPSDASTSTNQEKPSQVTLTQSPPGDTVTS